MTASPLTAPAATTRVAGLEHLRARVRGQVLEPGDDGYEALVSAWNLAVEMRPAAAVQALIPEDVVQTVRFAGAHGLTVGVQATGHGAVAAVAGQILVVTRRLDEISVDVEGRSARVGAGVKWSELVPHVAPHGLAGVSGSTTDVGIVGYTTGGGVGPLARSHGINADRVRAFEVVTGDGELRRVTPESHPDLFFALRGGKGAAGIITALEIDLIELPSFYGGSCFFAAEDMGEVLETWRQWSDRLPALGTTSVAVFQLPEADDVPPPLAGRMSLSVRFVWPGDPDEGKRLFDEIRAVAEPILDGVQVLPYAAIDAVHTDPVDPLPSHEASTLLHSFDEHAVQALLGVVGPGSGSAQVMVELRQLGGAYAVPGPHPAAFDHRGAAYCLLTVGIPGVSGMHEHAEAVLAAMAPWDSGRAWPNFSPPVDGEGALRNYDAATLERLASVVESYDPHGVMRFGGYTR